MAVTGNHAKTRRDSKSGVKSYNSHSVRHGGVATARDCVPINKLRDPKRHARYKISHPRNAKRLPAQPQQAGLSNVERSFTRSPAFCYSVLCRGHPGTSSLTFSASNKDTGNPMVPCSSLSARLRLTPDSAPLALLRAVFVRCFYKKQPTYKLTQQSTLFKNKGLKLKSERWCS